MNLKKNEVEKPLTRRSRLHEILIALIKQQKDLELMDDNVQVFETIVRNGSTDLNAVENLHSKTRT